MKCINCKALKVLHPSSGEAGYCTAPAGRKHRNSAIKVDHKIERNCILFKVARIERLVLEGKVK